MYSKESIEQSLSIARQCQRNWNSQTVDPNDVEFFKQTLIQIPKKQGRVFHYTVFVENQDIINNIYFNAREESVKIPHNGQMSAPLLVLFIPYDTGILPEHEEEVSENYNSDNDDQATYVYCANDIQVSIGIHSGMLALIANQLGYRTGFCSCFNSVAKKIFADLCKDIPRPYMLDYESTFAMGIGKFDDTRPHNYDSLHNTLMYRHRNAWDDKLHFCHIK